MSRRGLSGSRIALCLVLLPGLSFAAPARIVGGRAHVPDQALTRPQLAPSRPEPRPLREFPHDLYAPGTERTGIRPLGRELKAGARARAGAKPSTAAREAAVRTLRLAIIRVDFLADGAGALTTGNGRFDLRQNVSGVPVDPPPHNRAFLEAHAEALRRFYSVQSYGTLDIVATVFPSEADSAYHLEDTADYGPWEVSQNPDIAALAERFVTDALRAADASGDIDFGTFDAFTIVHAGPDFQGDINFDTPFDIPSFTLVLSESLAVTGGKVGRALVMPETGSQDDRMAALNGVFAHEFGHILGLPDLYNIFNGVPQVGYWSLMDNGENLTVQVEDPTSGDVFYADGIFPTSFDPWSRLQLFPDAVRDTLVEAFWQGSLEGILADSLLPAAFIDGLEYFLIENRALDMDGNGFPFVQQDSTTGVFMGPVDDPDRPGTGGRLEYDAVLPGGGLLIWHIDDRYAGPGYVSGAVNFQTGARGVAVEEADGVWDQGRFNFGTPWDPFFVGNNAKFGTDTVPNSSANDGAYSGIVIETTSPPGRFMDVSITRGLGLAGWPLPTIPLEEGEGLTTEPIGVTTVDMTQDLVPEIVLAATGTLTSPATSIHQIVRLPIDDVAAVKRFEEPLPSAVRPGLVASNGFVSAVGVDPRPVIGATLQSGRVYLWARDPLDASAADSSDVLNGLGDVGARTPPVIWDRAIAADAVLAAGAGTFHIITATGIGARNYASSNAVGQIPTAGPTLLLQHGDDWAAVAYQNGVIETFPLSASAAPPPPLRMGSAPRHLLSGAVDNFDTGPSLIAVSDDSIVVFAPVTGTRRAAWKLASPAAIEPVLGDIDKDNWCEIVLVDTAGKVLAWNGDGSPALGWPKQVQKPAGELKLLDLDADSDLDVLVLDAVGRFQGWSGIGTLLPTYPRALGLFKPVSSLVEAFHAPDSDPLRYDWIWVGTGEDVITGLPSLAALRVGAGAVPIGDWRYSGQARERGHRQLLPAGGPVTAEPALDHPLLAYPNPARDWVELRFLLDSDETADLEVLDLSGNVIDDARLDLRGGFRPGENAVRWELSDMAPGLYYCRLERSGGTAGSRVDMARVVVLR